MNLALKSPIFLVDFNVSSEFFEFSDFFGDFQVWIFDLLQTIEFCAFLPFTRGARRKVWKAVIIS